VLSGASSQWKGARPGKVFETFLNGEYANPVMVVDEIDKASADGQYDAAGYRDRTGIGRNLTVQVLEFLDRAGLSRFDGVRHHPLG
jgi:hypothetical protein